MDLVALSLIPTDPQGLSFGRRFMRGTCSKNCSCIWYALFSSWHGMKRPAWTWTKHRLKQLSVWRQSLFINKSQKTILKKLARCPWFAFSFGCFQSSQAMFQPSQHVSTLARTIFAPSLPSCPWCDPGSPVVIILVMFINFLAQK